MSAPEITFRNWRTGDVAALLRYANNRNVWINLKDQFPHPYTEEDAEAWIGMNHLMGGSPTNFAIEVADEAVGGIGLMVGEDVQSHTADIGYWVAEPFWGRGIATVAVRFISEYAFETFEVERLQANVFSWNAASARVLEKAGYRLEGRMRGGVRKAELGGDLLMYGRLRDDPAPAG